MRALILGSTLALIAFSAVAQDYSIPRPRDTRPSGVQTYDHKNDASVRLGTGCKLKLYGEDVYDGICNVGRGGPGNRVTNIDTGSRKYKIVRDDFDNTSGTFYSGNSEIGPVNARGSCWIGPEVKYCAN